MREKIKLHSNRRNYFSDVDYNTFVTGIKKVTASNSSTNAKNNIPKLHIHTSIAAATVKNLLDKIYGKPKLDSEYSRWVNASGNEIVITFDKGSGGTRTWYLNDLNAKRAGGAILTYSNTNPKLGYNILKTPIYLTETFLNPTVKSKEVPAVSAEDILSGSAGDNNPFFAGGFTLGPVRTTNTPPGGSDKDTGGNNNADVDDAGDASNKSKQTTIIIIAVVAVVLVLLFMRK